LLIARRVRVNTQKTPKDSEIRRNTMKHGYPAKVGALFTTVPVLGVVALVGLELWLVSGIALNKYCCD